MKYPLPPCLDVSVKILFGIIASFNVNDKSYLDWALEQVVCWEREIPDDEVIHIHGEKDMVFPIRYIDNCITVKNGTHIMIINKYKWFNENLPKLILS